MNRISSACAYGLLGLFCLHFAAHPASAPFSLPSATWWTVMGVCSLVAVVCDLLLLIIDVIDP